MLSSSATSMPTRAACSPCASSAPAASLPRVSSRAPTRTNTPCWANRVATSKPMPLFAPVMSAIVSAGTLLPLLQIAHVSQSDVGDAPERVGHRGELGCRDPREQPTCPRVELHLHHHIPGPLTAHLSTTASSEP